MKHAFFAVVSTILLTGCSAATILGSEATATYNLETDVTDMVKREKLADQAMRIIERRLERIGEIPTAVVKSVEADTMTIRVNAENQEALDTLTAELIAPFDLQIMAEAAPNEKPDVTVEGHGGFVATGVTHDDLEWVEGMKEPGKDMGRVILGFNEEGRAEMADLFKRMKGKNIGLFVRDQMVSKMEVETDEVLDEIIIREIPSPDLAIIFGDDVNVGINVTFTLVP